MIEQKLKSIEFADDLRLEMRRQSPAVASSELIEPKSSVLPQRLIPANALRKEQTLDAINMLNPLSNENPSFTTNSTTVFFLRIRGAGRAEVYRACGGDPSSRAPGTGKSHLATALAVEAVKAGKSVYFSTLADIIASLAKAEREGQLRERIRYLCRAALLVVDEIGYLPVVSGGGNLFFQLVMFATKRAP